MEGVEQTGLHSIAPELALLTTGDRGQLKMKQKKKLIIYYNTSVYNKNRNWQLNIHRDSLAKTVL